MDDYFANFTTSETIVAVVSMVGSFVIITGVVGICVYRSICYKKKYKILTSIPESDYFVGQQRIC